MHFERVLLQLGYRLRSYIQFDGSALIVYDSTLPSTTVLAPSDGATVRGRAAILDGSATYHGVGITRLQFVLTGGSYSRTVIGSVPPARFNRFGAAIDWNTTDVPNGTYELQTLVTDKDGKSSYSPAVSIEVDN